MNLSELRAILEAEAIRLTKSLGQNFLHDGNQVRRMIRLAGLGAGDRVLEIGPGLGALTTRLLGTGASVLAVEKDRRLEAILRRRLASESRLELVLADAVDFLRSEQRDWTDWQVVANLPYSAASVLLVDLARSPTPPRQITVTLQYEVLRRLIAQPRDADYGLLTLLIQLSYHAQSWFRIPATCFFPVPEIESACVQLVRKERVALTPQLRSACERIMRRAFSQRRKHLWKLLKQDWPEPDLQRAAEQLQWTGTVRGEELNLEQFIALTALLHPATPSPGPDPELAHLRTSMTQHE
jgi:16S rRNA (adenine1518-N6/adenine1519-N6)-dimethyltransferase